MPSKVSKQQSVLEVDNHRKGENREKRLERVRRRVEIEGQREQTYVSGVSVRKTCCSRGRGIRPDSFLI